MMVKNCLELGASAKVAPAKSSQRCLSGAFAAGAALMTLSQAQAAPQQANRADDFVDSIGVCLHVQNYNDTQWNTVRTQLGNLGVRHYRDGLEHVDNPTFKARLQSLYDSYGMQMLAVTGPWGNNNLQPTSTGSLQHIADKVAAIKPMVHAIEGPNEPEYFWYDPWNYGGFSDRASQVVWYQNKLYDTIKGDSRTSNIPVTTFATARSETTGNWYGQTKPLIKHDIIAWHHYNGRYLPNPWDWLNNTRINYSSNKPAYLTEHGYRVRGDNFVTQKGQLKLNVRSMPWFYNWNGNVKTYFYVAGVDTAEGEDYGLSNLDYSPRPVYNGMKNVIGYLKEATWNASTKTWNKPSFTPGTLDFTLSGDTNSVQWRLLQKSNGEFYLMMWTDINVANPADGSDYNNAPRNVAISFTSNRKVVMYQGNDSGAYSETTLTEGSTVTSVAVPDSVIILKISPGATPGPNLASNPGFEAEQFGTQTPSGWSESSTLGGVTSSYTDGGNTYAGNYKLSHYNGAAYKVFTYQTKTGLANGLYTARVWARKSGGQIACRLEVSNFGGTTRTATIPNAGPYQLVEIRDINVTNGQCTFGVYSDANAGNWTQFDNFEFFRQAGNTTTPTIPVGQRIGFKSNANNKFVSTNVNNSSFLQASWADSVGNWERFDVVDAGNGQVALKSVQTGKYVTCDLNTTERRLRADWSTSIGGWERFTWQDLGSNTFALKSVASNKFVTADLNSVDRYLKANTADSVGNSERFTWVAAP